MLIADDDSDAARAAIAAAGALFGAAETTVATVQAPPPTVEAAAMTRVALPDAVIREAAVALVGSRGRGAVAGDGAELGRSGLVHAAALPVHVVPAVTG